MDAISDLEGGDPRSYMAKLALAVQNHEQNLAFHRERRRKNQIRYRKKQRELAMSLEDDVRELENEIRELETRRHSASMGVPTQQTLWSIVTEYLRLFRHGFRSPPQTLQNVALKFLRASMAPDVMDGYRCGPEALLKKWKLFSQFFADVHIELERLEKGVTADSLVAITTTSVTISEATMSTVFPRLNADGHSIDDGGKRSRLAHKLLNQRLIMSGSVRFVWDKASDCVVKIESQSDMLTPMLGVLGSLEDVSLVFEGALVTPDCQLASLLQCHW